MLKKFLKTLKRRLAYSRFNREQIQRELAALAAKNGNIDAIVKGVKNGKERK